MDYYEHRVPCDATQIGRFRIDLGEDGLELLLKASIDTAKLCGIQLKQTFAKEVKTLLQDSLPAQSYGRMLLVPGSKAPIAVKSRGKVICTCLNVTDEAIFAQLKDSLGDAEQRLNMLKSTLKCGTNCGSCVPEIKRMTRVNPSSAELLSNVEGVLEGG